MINIDIFEHHLLLISMTIIIARILTVTFSNNIYIYSVIHLVGTFLHELMHLLISFLFNGKPKGFSIFPTKDERGNFILGYVSNSNLTWYNKFPISIAPLLIWILIYYFDLYFFLHFDKNILSQLAYIFVVSVLIINSIPSKKDLGILFSCPSGIIFYSFIIFLVLQFYFKG